MGELSLCALLYGQQMRNSAAQNLFPSFNLRKSSSGSSVENHCLVGGGLFSDEKDGLASDWRADLAFFLEASGCTCRQMV